MSSRRRELLDMAAIVFASVSLVLLYALLRRLGLPFGLRVVPMGEDYNWLLILRGPSLAAQAQAFWEMNDRNPLSPWWYIAAQTLYKGLPNGPLLTRLAMNPLLGAATYAVIRVTAAPEGRGLALAVGLAVALSSFSAFIDQILWNFLGALALTLLCITAFGIWLRSGRRAVGWYGAALCLWFGALASYTFQVGGVLAVTFLSLLSQRNAWKQPARVLGRTTAEVAPFAILLILFVLVWTTTRNPLMSAYYELHPHLLFAMLPQSLAQGLWPARYAHYVGQAFNALHWWLLLPVCAAGLFVGILVSGVMRGVAPQPGPALKTLSIAACVVLPTALIESVSPTWSVGMRWLMVDQAWQPMLWLSLGWLVLAAVPRWRDAFPALSGLAAGCVVALSLGHNAVQTRAAAIETALHDGVISLVAAQADDRLPLHIIVLVKDDVPMPSRDVMNIRTGMVWFDKRPITLRTLQRGAEPAEPSHAVWWKVVFQENGVGNAAIGGGDASYDQVVFATFDGQRVQRLDRLTEADVAGYPAEWRRGKPLDATSRAAASCPQTWRADENVPLSGFRSAEVAPGGAYRWMVANPAHLTLTPACDGAAELQVDIAMALDPAQMRSLSVTVAGSPIHLAFLERDGGVIAQGEVPAGLLTAGQPAILELHIDALRRVPGTNVQLGLALRAVSVSSLGAPR